MIKLPESERQQSQILHSFRYHLMKAKRLCEQRQTELNRKCEILVTAKRLQEETQATLASLEAWKTFSKDAQTAAMQSRAIACKKKLSTELSARAQAAEVAQADVKQAEQNLKTALQQSEKAELKLSLAQTAIRKAKRRRISRATDLVAEEIVNFRSAS